MTMHVMRTEDGKIGVSYLDSLEQVYIDDYKDICLILEPKQAREIAQWILDNVPEGNSDNA